MLSLKSTSADQPAYLALIGCIAPQLLSNDDIELRSARHFAHTLFARLDTLALGCSERPFAPMPVLLVLLGAAAFLIVRGH